MADANNLDSPSQPQTNVMETRVGRLEGVVQTLSKEVGDVTKSVRDITISLGTFKEDVLARLGIATAPKWPLIASISTLIVTILGLGGTVIVILLAGQRCATESNQQAIHKLNDRAYQQAYDAGEAHAQTEHMEAEIKRLKDYIGPH